MGNNIVYLDNASTTKPFKVALDYYKKFSYDNYFNPSSIHRGGIKCKTKIEEAREYFSNLLGIKNEELIFTSGATESNNTIIRGVGNKLKRNEYIVSTGIEHKSIRENIKQFPHKILEVNSSGKIKIPDLKNKVTSNTKLLSFILTNNETGIIQNYKEIIQNAKDINPKILIHIDAVQSFGKILTSIQNSNIDFLSISGHKIHAPKGIGILYKNKDIPLPSLIKGGNQENNNRAGTENIGAIIGFYKATEKFINNKKKYIKKLRNFSIYLKSKINKMENYNLNSDKDNKFQFNIISLYHNYIPGSVILKSLSDNNIYISTGSACNENTKDLNPVLKNLGYSKKRIKNTFRISLSVFNKKRDIEKLVYTLKEIDNSISHIYKEAQKE